VKLAKLIKRDLGKTGKTKREIALNLTEYDKKKAENLLRQLRNFPHLLD
jgi:hypothetical protein